MLWRIPWIDLHLRLLDMPYYDADPIDPEEIPTDKKVELYDSFFNDLND